MRQGAVRMVVSLVRECVDFTFLTQIKAARSSAGRRLKCGVTGAHAMSLYTLGLNHQTAPLDVRERVAFSPDALGHALRDLLATAEGQGSGDPVDVQPDRGLRARREPQPVVRWLEDFHRVPADSLAPYIYTLPREQAVTHAFRVASGLDSMVLGEPQILGQMKQAVRHAEVGGHASAWC